MIAKVDLEIVEHIKVQLQALCTVVAQQNHKLTLSDKRVSLSQCTFGLNVATHRSANLSLYTSRHWHKVAYFVLMYIKMVLVVSDSDYPVVN